MIHSPCSLTTLCLDVELIKQQMNLPELIIWVRIKVVILQDAVEIISAMSIL